MSKLAGIVLTVFAATVAAVAPVRAQSFPDRPIKVIVAYPAGGPTDTVARLATQNIAEQLGQGMIVENVAGAGGRIGTRDVARAAPDGYTLLLGGTNDNAIAPVLYKSLDYDPAKDFVPVSALATDSNAIVVNPEVPVHTLAELASYTKANPGKLTSGATLASALNSEQQTHGVRAKRRAGHRDVRQPSSQCHESGRHVRRGVERRALAGITRRADAARKRARRFPDRGLVRADGAARAACRP